MTQLKKLGHLYFCGRAGFVMITNLVFPQGTLTAITSVGDWDRRWGSGARAGYLFDGTSSLLSGQYCLIGGEVWSQVARVQALRVGS